MSERRFIVSQIHFVLNKARGLNRARNHVKKTQLDAQLILSIFRQRLQVSGISRPIIRRYNCMYITVDCNIRSSKKNNKYQLLYAASVV